VPLDPQKRQELIDAATAAGVDPAEVIAEAEKIAAGEASTGDREEQKGGLPALTAEAAPIFAYLMAFFTADEIRKTRGFGPGKDGQLYAGEWLERHGGVLTPAPAGGAGGEPAGGGEPE
jgi:hypothetical protein